MIRLFRLLALTIITIVCAGITSPASAIASLTSSTELVARDSADAIQWESALQPSQKCENRRDDAERYVADLDAVEADDDDDDVDDDDDGRETQPDLADDATAPYRDLARGGKLGRARRVEQIDTSRFAFGKALARGPPA